MDEDLVAILRTQRAKVARSSKPTPDEVKRAEGEAREAAEAALRAKAAPLPELEVERVGLREFEPIGPIEVVAVESNPGPPAVSGPAVERRGVGAPQGMYPREEIVRVLRAWRGRQDGPQRVSTRSLERPGFSHKAVRRVIRLDDEGAFRLGPRGGLRCAGINGEFRPAGERVSLRALERLLGLGSLD